VTVQKGADFMKPHRQIRHSKRVSSETGVAITAVQPPRQAPPVERRSMLAELAREELSES